MPFKLEKWGDKAIVTNTRTGKHYSNEPIAMESAMKQMRILEGYRAMKEGVRSDSKPKDDPPPRRWIQEVTSSPSFKKGAFTAQAKRAGKTTKEMMKDVLAHPEDYSKTTRRRAQFMKNVA